MEDREPPSLTVRLAGPLVFIVGSIGALFWFGFSVFVLLENLNNEIVSFDKGAFYMLGVGLGSATLSFVLIYEFWHGKPLTKRLNILCTKLAFFSIILLLLTPQAIHLLTGNYLENRGLTLCEQASSQWLFVSEIVYVDDDSGCDGISKRK